jgi:hypothetical protein
MEINMKKYNLNSFKEKDIYSWEEIINIIEELETKIYEQEEEIKNYEENYVQKKVDPYEEYGVSERDFY